jgi:exosortase C (VPDSG-CTERM-specific)
VPFISAYLIFMRRKKLCCRYGSSPLLAVVSLTAGLAALATACRLRVTDRLLSHNDYLALMAFSFVCLLTAAGFLFLGRKWVATAAFPIAFLILIVPLPDRAAQCLETASQLASTDAAHLFFILSGTPVSREGTVFQLPGIMFQVAQECSGIHSSWVLFITSLLAAHLFLKNPWRRTLLVLFVIPLGILRNGFRILVIGLLCVHINPQMIHSTIHTQGGPLFFVVSLLPLFFLLWWLRSYEAEARNPGSSLKRMQVRNSEP